MIVCENVSKRYAGEFALKGLTLEIQRGEMAFLTGHSGAGKTTLMRMLGLLERPSAGKVHVGGIDLAKVHRRQIPFYRRRIGIIFQNYKLLYDRPVFDNVALPLMVAGMSRVEVARRVRAALDLVGLLHKENAQPVTLSGGEQQRVGIARAIIHRPAILLADEPTGNLDPTLSSEIMRLFLDFNNAGITVLISSHDLSLVARTGKRVLTLQQGQLVSG